ncbi:MAG TPA: MFS transporter [Gemmatimonadales bacterium]|nr:MFS transporter [Gemmatimonadales bacterium]
MAYSTPVSPDRGVQVRSVYRSCAVIGLGGLFAGITGPLISTFVPPLVQGVLGDDRTGIGFVMAIDNVLLLLLVPWAGPASDRAAQRGRGRMRFVIGGLLLAAVGMALLPTLATALAPLIAGIVILNVGINLQRAPFQALVADVVPSRWRSLATGSVTFQMCVGAIVFLMLGRMLGMRPAFLIAAGSVVAVAGAFLVWLREPPATTPADEVTYRSLLHAALSALRGGIPAVRPIFVATLLLQLTFQTFTTWYALHGTERFGVRPEDVTVGFIAWAVGGVVGALPAGWIGVRFGRRRAMLIGFGLMGACLLALDRVTSVQQAVPLLALAAASWTFPMVNAFPLFVEPVPAKHRGVLGALYVLCMALGGAIGDPLNGGLFDLFGGYRALFLMMAGYVALALVAVLVVPRGTGESAPDGNG